MWFSDYSLSETVVCNCQQIAQHCAHADLKQSWERDQSYENDQHTCNQARNHQAQGEFGGWEDEVESGSQLEPFVLRPKRNIQPEMSKLQYMGCIRKVRDSLTGSRDNSFALLC